MTTVTSLALPADTAAVRQARHFARDYCSSAGVAAEATDRVVLLTSQVVTNALLHGRSAARLSVTMMGGLVLVEVGDDSRRHPYEVERSNEAEEGRGLLLLGLAQRWGVRDETVGKTVWFEVQSPERTQHKSTKSLAEQLAPARDSPSDIDQTLGGVWPIARPPASHSVAHQKRLRQSGDKSVIGQDIVAVLESSTRLASPLDRD